MKKKLLLALTLLLSFSTVGVNANAIEMGKPSNLSVEKQKDAYKITFKNSENAKNLSKDNDIKVELDIKANKNDWSSKNEKVIVKDFNNNAGKGEIILPKDEVINHLNQDPNHYSIRLRYANNNEKSNFSDYVTMGSVGIYSNSSNWAESELLEAQKMGLISPELKKDMKKEISREEFAELIVKAAEKGNLGTSHVEEIKFRDTTNKYVSYACSLNLMNGTWENTFAPKVSMTREDMAVSINRLLSNSEKIKEDKKVKINDEKNIAPYAKESVDKIVSNNILNLDKNGNFNPKKKVTREEAVITVYRAIK